MRKSSKAHKKRKRERVCKICGVWNGKGVKEITTHHIKPRSEGGSDRWWNKIDVCLGCHMELHKSEKVVVND